MAELREDDLLPGELSEDDLAPEKTSETLTERPDGVKVMKLEKVAKALPDDVTDAERAYAASHADAAPVDKKDALRTMMDPKSVTGATAAGVSKGFTVGFGDEIAGALDADSARRDEMDRVTENAAGKNQKRLDADALVEAARHGTDAVKAEHDRQTAASAPVIPGVTSYTLKRPGQQDVTKSAVAKSPHETESAAGVPWAEAYRKTRDDMRAQYATAEKEHPVAFGAGELAGGLAVPLPGPGKATGLAKVGQYGWQGLKFGTAAGLGYSDAELADPEHMEVGKALDDTKNGAVGGIGAGMLLGGAAMKLDPWLEKQASRSAAKALGPYMATLDDALGKRITSGEAPLSEGFKKIEETGRRALDEGIIPEGPLERFANTEEINDRVVRKARESGELLGGTKARIGDDLTKAGVPNPVSRGQIATELEKMADKVALDDPRAAAPIYAEVANIRQGIVNRAKAGIQDPAAMSFEDAEKWKTLMQGRVDYGRPLEDQQAASAAARLSKEHPERAVETVLGPEELDQYKALKNRHGNLKDMAETSGHSAIREFRNQGNSLGAKVLGAGAASAAHGPMAVPAAAATMALHNVANHRGTAGYARTLANIADRYSPLLVPAAEEVGTGEGRDKWKQFLGEEE